MRSPIPCSPAKALRSRTAGVLSPAEAATRLARLEFDVARLEREIASSERRAEKARRALARHVSDRHLLLAIVGRDRAVSSRRTL